MLNILADALLIALRANAASASMPRDRFPSRPVDNRWVKRNDDRV